MSFSKDLAVMEMNGYKLNGKRIQFPVYHVDGVPVEELNLSNRAINGLKRNQVDTIDAVLDTNLERMKNIGVKSIREIKNAILNYSYERMNPQQKTEFWKSILV